MSRSCTLVLTVLQFRLLRLLRRFNPHYSPMIISVLGSLLLSTHGLVPWRNPFSVFTSSSLISRQSQLVTTGLNWLPPTLLVVPTTSSVALTLLRVHNKVSYVRFPLPSFDLGLLGCDRVSNAHGGCDHVSNAHGGCIVYPLLAILSCSKGFSPHPLFHSWLPILVSRPSRPASNLNPPHCRVCRSSEPSSSRQRVMPPLLFSSFWSLRSLSRHFYLFGCRLSALRRSYSYASSALSDIHLRFAPASASVLLLSLFYYIAILIIAILECCLDLTLLC